MKRCERSSASSPATPPEHPYHRSPTPEALAANCQGTAALYERVCFVPPWIGYVAVVDGHGVGGGAFVGPSQDGVIEIAYYTLDRRWVDVRRLIPTNELRSIDNGRAPMLSRQSFVFYATGQSLEASCAG